MNSRKLMYKLQSALCAQGVHVRINQRQHFSEKAQKMVTRYIVQEEGEAEPLIETYAPHEVVKTLADRLSGGDMP